VAHGQYRGGPATPKSPKKKKKVLAFWGWLDQPQGPRSHPHTSRKGWPNPPQALGGGPATFKSPKLFFFFFFFGLLGVAEPPFWPWGWFDHPQISCKRWLQALGGGPTTPKRPKPFFFFWAFGPPPISFFFLKKKKNLIFKFFFLKFLFNNIFLKKKNGKTVKTTLF
jgi:hypothetical protein